MDAIGNRHILTSRCFSCGLLTSESKKFADSLKNGDYYDFSTELVVDPPNIAGFNPQDQAGSDANSRLLIKVCLCTIYVVCLCTIYVDY